MITITDDSMTFPEDEFQLFSDLMRLYAAIATNPTIKRVNQMAIKGVQRAAEENMLNEILGIPGKHEDKNQ